MISAENLTQKENMKQNEGVVAGQLYSGIAWDGSGNGKTRGEDSAY